MLHATDTVQDITITKTFQNRQINLTMWLRETRNVS